MQEIELISQLFRYNSYVRKKYLRLFETMSWEELNRNREASFHSLKGVFLHTLDVYEYWMTPEEKRGSYRNMEERIRVSGVEDMKRCEEETDRKIMEFIGAIQQKGLDGDAITYYGGREEHVQLRDLLLHLVEEELQHRGELNCLLWQMDIEPPVTGYDDWRIEERGRSS